MGVPVSQSQVLIEPTTLNQGEDLSEPLANSAVPLSLSGL